MTNYMNSVVEATLWRSNEEGLKEVESLITDIREFREFRQELNDWNHFEETEALADKTLTESKTKK